MVNTTFAQTRTHIESLVSDDGTYELVCGRTGEQPVPVDGFRFEDHETTEATVCAARRYRSAPRQYDPNVPYYDLIVSEYNNRSGFGGATTVAEGQATVGATSRLPELPHDLGADVGGRTGCMADGNRSEWVELCHRIAVTVFETLVDANHRVVEIVMMDVCFDLAEMMSSTDGLCLRLLESMVTALHVHLVSTEQADVLERAASNLVLRLDATKTLAAMLAEMEWLDLIESYTCSAWRPGPDATTRTAELTLEDYVPSACRGRLPVLPVVLELYRRTSSWRPVSPHAMSTKSGRHATPSMSSALSAVGLASIPTCGYATD